MNPNNTSFSSQLYEELKKVPLKNDDGFYYHQRITYTYFLQHPSVRGLLVLYETGYGKSRTASSIAELGLEQGWEPIILAAKTLHENFRKGLIEYKKTLPKNKGLPEAALQVEIDDNYEFISSNASNMADQMQKQAMDDVLESKMEAMINNIPSLEGKFVIIDEAHNIFNAITHGSKNATKLYQMIMNTKKIKVLFLTANPVVNDPFELVPCFNMIEGYLYDRSSNRKHTLFPEDWEHFYKYFVDTENLTIKNADKFKNRILGKSSYYGSLYEGNPKSQTGRKDVITRLDFPDELPTIIVEVPMGKEQYAQYIIAEDEEKKESKRIFGQRSKVALQRPGLEGSSSYRIKTRQISNFLFPPNVDKKASPEARVQQLRDVDIQDLSRYGAKLQVVRQNMQKHKKNIVYSQFLNGTIRVLEKHLELHGWTKWDPASPAKNSSNKSRVYAEISGDVPAEDRALILSTYNSENNMYGKVINDLFITSAGSEGLDTQDVDAVHQIEPYWNPSRDMQVKARAIRLRSHNRRPAKERIVQPYLYLSIAPADADRKEPTTDTDLHAKSKNALLLNQSFRHAVIEASIDCLIHSSNAKSDEFEKLNMKCMLCQPTDRPLYSADIAEDMILASPCQPYQSEQIKVKTIKIDGEKYHYLIGQNGLEVFKFDDSLNAYVPVDEREPIYNLVSSKVH
jgi:hypothetical protein